MAEKSSTNKLPFTIWQVRQGLEIIASELMPSCNSNSTSTQLSTQLNSTSTQLNSTQLSIFFIRIGVHAWRACLRENRNFPGGSKTSNCQPWNGSKCGCRARHVSKSRLKRSHHFSIRAHIGCLFFAEDRMLVCPFAACTESISNSCSVFIWTGVSEIAH